MNNYNMNWMFNPPNLFGMRRNPNRNYYQNTQQRSQNSEPQKDTAVSDDPQHTNITEPEPIAPKEVQESPSRCGEGGEQRAQEPEKTQPPTRYYGEYDEQEPSCCHSEREEQEPSQCHSEREEQEPSRCH
ncbi:MAG: hypothetical protein K2G16_02300, partial [Lachnospiraceae bacterium]|nr:hypothetical protein [Lachnospiraceae bacterium]